MRQLKPNDPRCPRGTELSDILRQKSQDYAETHGRYIRRVVDAAQVKLKASEAEHTVHQLEVARILESQKKLCRRLKQVSDAMSTNHAGAIVAGRSAVAAVNSSMAGEADEPVLLAAVTVEAVTVTNNKLENDCPNPSKPIQTHPNPSKPTQTHPNPSKPIQTHPNASTPIQNHPNPPKTHPNPSKLPKPPTPPIKRANRYFQEVDATTKMSQMLKRPGGAATDEADLKPTHKLLRKEREDAKAKEDKALGCYGP